jgi:hypothetical protein
MTLLPAYGRDYRTADEVLADWNADKDFVILDVSWPEDSGRYINKRDAERGDLKWVTFKIRYGTILNTGFMWPNFVLIRMVLGAWVLGDGTE